MGLEKRNIIKRRTDNCFGDKYFIQGGQLTSPERGGVLLVDMFPNNLNFGILMGMEWV